MFYIQLIGRHRDRLESPASKENATSEPSEVDEKSANLALLKTTEYIRNAQQLYYLERQLFC